MQRIKDSVLESQSQASLHIDAEVERIKNAVIQSEKNLPSRSEQDAMVTQIVSSVLGNVHSNAPNDPKKQPQSSAAIGQNNTSSPVGQSACHVTNNLVENKPIGTLILPIMPPERIKRETDDLDPISEGQTSTGNSVSPRKRKKKMKDSLNEAIYLSGSESDPDCKEDAEVGQNVGEHLGDNTGQNIGENREHNRRDDAGGIPGSPSQLDLTETAKIGLES